MKKDQQQIIDTVFCPMCLWIIGKYLTKDKLTDKQNVAAKKHYLSHFNLAFKVIVTKKSNAKKVRKT